MKKLVKLVFGVFVVGIALLILIVINRDTILRVVIEQHIQAETGLDTRIGDLHFGLRKPIIQLENFKIYNPDQFGGAPLVNIRELRIEYDPVALASRKLHLKFVNFNLAEVNMVEGADGRTNMELLQQKQNESALLSQKSGTNLEFTGIDTLKLTLGTVRFSSIRDPAKGRAVALNVKDYELKNVKSTADLWRLLLGLLIKNGVNFLGGDISALTGAIIPTLKAADIIFEKMQKNAVPTKTSP